MDIQTNGTPTTTRAEVVTREPAIPMGLTLAEYVTGYAEAIGQAANRLARSFLLPDALRITAKDSPEEREGKVRDVGVLLARALSTREDLMALAQSIYLVGGRPALASAYLVARAQQIGAIRGAPQYRTEGEWPEISVTATVRTPDGEEHAATVSMQEAREDGWASRNPKYRSHRPAENMLCHRAAARLMRRVAPGVVLGMAVAEEAMDYDERPTPARAPSPARGAEALGLRRADRPVEPATGVVPESRQIPERVEEPEDYAAEVEALRQRQAAEVEDPRDPPVEERPAPAPRPTGRDRAPVGYGPKLAALGWSAEDIVRMCPPAQHDALDGGLTPATHRVDPATRMVVELEGGAS